MQIKYKMNVNLPPLAWRANCKDGIVEVLHGKYVDARDGFFVEGAWSGNFADGDFVNSEWVCGSGACFADDKITFSTATHIVGGLFHISIDNKFCISNSLYLLMAENGYQLDPQYMNYEKDFNTILFGVEDYKKDIHVLNEHNEKDVIQVSYFRNITIDSNGDIEIKIKPSVKAFSSFEDYYSRLKQSVATLIANGKDKDRAYQYGTVTTISRGYDAPCCAAVAKTAGCDNAVTFKPNGKYADDCGTEIAELLGYSTIIERDAADYLTRDNCVEAMYVATGELGADISLAAFDDDFSGNLVFTGERGDSVWDRNAKNRNNKFAFNAVFALLGCTERRLWLNYISVPMPLYGASAWESLYDIANSEEMKDWRTNNSYDRPIPRRIIESAGVPRNKFGIMKHGAGFIYRYDWMNRIKTRMAPSSWESFKSYVSKHKKLDLGKIISYFWTNKEMYLSRLGLKLKIKQPVEYSQIANPLAARYLIPWGGGIMLARYLNVLEPEK